MDLPRKRLEDELLVLLCQQGRAEAFSALVERWQSPLVQHARRLLGDEDAAWDVIQEAWVAIAKGLGRLQNPGAFPRWAYTIVSRRVADHLRRAVRRRAAVPLEEGLDLDQLSPDEARPTEQVTDAVGLLREALHHLAPEQRALLSLHHLEEFNVSEIASILDVPEGTVKSRLHTARQELRRLIERMDR